MIHNYFFDVVVIVDKLAPDLILEVQQLMIPEEEIQFEEEVGRGSFAKVWRGKWQGQTIAIKEISTVREIHSSATLSKTEIAKKFGEFRREVSMMRYLRVSSSFHYME
jgi:serine/threonine protein kinase